MKSPQNGGEQDWRLSPQCPQPLRDRQKREIIEEREAGKHGGDVKEGGHKLLVSKGTERLRGPSHADHEEGNPGARAEDSAGMLSVYSNRAGERTVVTPVRSVEETGIFK